MLLRASGEREGFAPQLHAVTAASGDGAVPAGDLLRELTETAIRSEWAALATARRRGHELLGAQATTDVLTVAAAFNGITRVADATGIPLDSSTAQATVALRADTGIAEFAYDRKSARYR